MRAKSLCIAFCLLVAAVSARAQDQMINLNPNEINALPCGELLEGFGVNEGDLNAAVSHAAAGGYRLGYVMGYVHGVLDEPGKQRPLEKGELDKFIDTYKLICKENAKLSIYEATRNAMKFQTR
jgi:hypothetical protein